MTRKPLPSEARPETTEHICNFIRQLRERPELRNTNRHDLLTLFHLTAHEAKIVMALLRCYDTIFPPQQNRSVADETINLLAKMNQENETRLEAKESENKALREEIQKWERKYWSMVNNNKKKTEQACLQPVHVIPSGLTSRNGMINGRPINTEELPIGDLPF